MAIERVVSKQRVKKYIGLSTETKPTIDVPVGSEFYETDTGDLYVFSGSAWVFKVIDVLACAAG